MKISAQENVKDLLSAAGFQTVEGKDAVLEKIFNLADGKHSIKLCSGFRVFPDGEKCLGCPDCHIIESMEGELK